MLAFNMI